MLDLQAINAKYGLNEEETDQPVDVNITEQDVNQLRSIMAKGGEGGIDTKPKPAAPSEAPKGDRPSYLDEFKDLLEKKYDSQEEDRTDWTQKALAELGTNFTHINTREAFQTEMFLRESQFNFLNQLPDVKILQDLTKGIYDARLVLTEHVKSKLDQDDPTFDEQLKARIDQFFEEDGSLSQRGKVRYGELIAGYKTQLAAFYNEAKEYSNKELTKYNEFKTTLLSELKTFKPAGIELPAELTDHLANFITSGKAKEFYDNPPKTPKEAAQREILLAIIADPKAFAEFINMVDARGIHYGATESSKKYFKQSN